MTPAGHIEKARHALATARYLLTGEFADKAGREAYLAGFHAALAFVLDRSGKSPKTHSGTRSEFARLARQESSISREQIGFLGWTYELKTVADYGQEQPVAIDDAHRAIREASELIETIAPLVAWDGRP